MNTENDLSGKLNEYGFAIINNFYSATQVDAIIRLVESVATDDQVFRKSKDLFAIRQVLQVIPDLQHFIFTEHLSQLIHQLFGNSYFVVKSIYFDKPPLSNWVVPYHQDLTISVDKKADVEGYSCWTVKQNQFAVQPPVALLQSNFTIRIHLDDTDENNGALKVIPGSHLNGIVRIETLNRADENEYICKVKKGGIILMRPLLLHASNRTTNGARRRVIHIEFSNCTLPQPLQWSEYFDFNHQLH